MHKYYSLYRPIGIGCCPKQGLKEVVNFDSRKLVEEIDNYAWGYVIYDHELSPEEAARYELEQENDSENRKQ